MTLQMIFDLNKLEALVLILVGIVALMILVMVIDMFFKILDDPPKKEQRDR